MRLKHSDICKHISDLLFVHDFVSIADFGSFVTNYKSAQITEQGILPPSKSITFNSSLKTDDGLLTSYLSGLYNIDYKKSKAIIAEFVKDIFINLDNKKQVKFENIGLFEFDKNYNLIFEPDIKFNFLADSFGFSTIHYPVLEQTSEKINVILKDRKKLKKSLISKPAKIIYLILPILILASVISIKTNILNKSEYSYSNIADVVNIVENKSKSLIERQLDSMTKKENALMYNEKIKPIDSEKSFNIKKEINTKTVEAKTKKIETIEIKKESEIKETPKQKIKKEPKIVEKEIEAKTKKEFILVAGSFSTIRNAKKFVNKLAKKDISAEIINYNGKYRVSAASFDTKKEAKKEGESLKTQGIKTWVSKR